MCMYGLPRELAGWGGGSRELVFLSSSGSCGCRGPRVGPHTPEEGIRGVTSVFHSEISSQVMLMIFLSNPVSQGETHTFPFNKQQFYYEKR